MNNSRALNTSLSNETAEGYTYLDEGCEAFTETAVEKWTKVTACLLVLITAVIGNIFIVTVVSRGKKLQTVTNCFVANMAVSDLLIALVNIPELIKEEVTGSDNSLFVGGLGSFLCKFSVLTQDVSAFCSILSLIAIACDRFVAIWLPYRKVMTTNNVKYVVIIIWIVSFIVSSPLLYANKLTEDEYGHFCKEEWTPAFKNSIQSSRAYTITTFILLYVLPLLIISALYSGVIYQLWHQTVPGDQRTSASRQQRAKSKKRVLRMLILIVAIFALCWAPYHVYYFLDNYYYTGDCGGPWNLYFCGKFIAYANSAVNPCIFITFDRGMRRFISSQVHPCCDMVNECVANHVPRAPSRFYTASNTGQDPSNVKGVKLTRLNLNKMEENGEVCEGYGDVTRSAYLPSPSFRSHENNGFNRSEDL